MSNSFVPMFRLALHMLFGDIAKYLMLVAGLFFATFLMLQPLSTFCGLMFWTTSILKNAYAPIYVVEERVEQINETNPLRNTDLARVRSVDSVRWAMPLFSSLQRARLENGAYKTIQLLGIDSATLTGAPTEMIEGRLEDLNLPNSVIVDDYALKRLSVDLNRPIKVGDVFEINDIEAKVVGICRAQRAFFGAPFVWTTYDQAMRYTPAQRKMLSAIMVAPKEGIPMAKVAQDIAQETGLKAFTNIGYKAGKGDFNYDTMWWFVKNTGIPISIGTTVVIGFIVGLAISCQTFYAFVLDHLKHLGAMKAMGASNFKLSLMLLLQASVVGGIGYGIGLLAVTGFAKRAIAMQQPPFYMPTMIPIATFGVIQLICMIAALIGMFRLNRYEPAQVFRA